jgi:hexulose-6-phosphate isomerase
MQGRFSQLIDGRIQAFPWNKWQDEFRMAEQMGVILIEWTLDQDKLYENPLLTPTGQASIGVLCSKHGINIPSLTGDCFMQSPFWKASGNDSERLKKDFQAVAEACVNVGISMIVVPLVDNGRIENRGQESALVDFLEGLSPFLCSCGLQVLFESDLGPEELACFINPLDPLLFGINYDIGNSAAASFDPTEEIQAYGQRILNVHVKDRMLGGPTVPLGTGNADFDRVFSALGQVQYQGNYILQTARAVNGDHTGVLSRYRNMTYEWVTRYGS